MQRALAAQLVGDRLGHGPDVELDHADFRFELGLTQLVHERTAACAPARRGLVADEGPDALPAFDKTGVGEIGQVGVTIDQARKDGHLRQVDDLGAIRNGQIGADGFDFGAADKNDLVRERDMLIDFAPYLFRGKLSGFLTRLSATGLANVTSGGGQVPAFVVSSRS